MDKLKPCPFCGDNVTHVKFNDGFSTFDNIVCNPCGLIKVMVERSNQEVIESWNKRTTYEPQALPVIIPENPKDWFLGYKCPKCNESFCFTRKYDLKTPPNYCQNCGQKLDWSDAE
jgi:Lar family restriction alleviation protein